MAGPLLCHQQAVEDSWVGGMEGEEQGTVGEGHLGARQPGVQPQPWPLPSL